MTKALLAAVLIFAQVGDEDVTLEGCEFVSNEGGKVWIVCPELDTNDSGKCEKLAEGEWSCRV